MARCHKELSRHTSYPYVLNGLNSHVGSPESRNGVVCKKKSFCTVLWIFQQHGLDVYDYDVGYPWRHNTDKNAFIGEFNDEPPWPRQRNAMTSCFPENFDSSYNIMMIAFVSGMHVKCMLSECIRYFHTSSSLGVMLWARLQSRVGLLLFSLTAMWTVAFTFL